VTCLSHFLGRVLRFAAVAGAVVVMSANSAACTLIGVAVVAAVVVVLLVVLVAVLARGTRRHAALVVLSFVFSDRTRTSAGRRRTCLEPWHRPVHRSIVVVDVEGFGDKRRTNWHQIAVRDGLYQAMHEAFDHAGIRWAGCDHEDRGDGVFVLVPADVPKELLIESLPPALVMALDRHNGTHQALEQIRLRMALHAGEISYDEHGTTAAAVNLAFRLSDADALKAALAASPGVLAVITSSWFFQEVVRHNPACNADAYRRVRVAVKETTTIGWIHIPEHSYSPSCATVNGWLDD
jgi:class 3 adenylate cyclase